MADVSARHFYRRQNKLPVRRMLVGLFLLFSPSINLFDLLPDFIGCTLIISALFDASEVLPYFGELRDKLKTYFWVSLSRYPALFAMMSIYSGDSSQRSIITVFAVGYAIVDLICLLPAVGYFWEAFFYFGERFDCPEAIAPVGRVKPETLHRLTAIFFIVREAGSCLPEFALIPVTPGDLSSSTVSFWLSLYPKLAVAAAVLVFVFGIWLFTVFCRYFTRLSRAGNADRLISERYEEDADRINSLHTVEGLRIFFLLVAVSVALGIDVVFDRVNVLPDVFSAVLTVISLLFLRRRFNGVFVERCAAFAGCYAVVSTVTTVLSTIFYDRYGIDALASGVPAAKRLYLILSVAGGVEAAAAIFVSILLFAVLARLIPLSVGSLGHGLARQTEEIERALRRENGFILAVSLLSAAATFAEILLARLTSSAEVLRDPESGLTTSVTIARIDWFWMVPLVLSILRLVVFLHFTGRLRDEAREKYIGIY
ncbi:MAG: hypothetical protein J6Z04_02415 [Clostridia bacterium]|nr:hypothetical protein [Clostridia bacterium]